MSPDEVSRDIQRGRCWVLAEFSIVPLGSGESVGHYVSRAIEIVAQSGLDYRVNPMGTVIEGSWDEVMALIKRCHDEILKDCGRVLTRVVIDDRPAGGRRIEAKVSSIERRIGRVLER